MWHPIETAPFYVEILVYNGKYWRVVVRHSYGFRDPRTQQSLRPKATHWMPLPPAPEPSMICARCGADRFAEPCRNNLECQIRGLAQPAPESEK